MMAEFLTHLTGLEVSVFAGVFGNPTCRQVMDGAAAYRAHQADCVIGFGGGAALDVAKVVGVAATHEGDILEYVWDHPQVRPITRALPYFVALPTTAGTGSEVGRSSVLSENDSHLKRVVFSPKILAQMVFAIALEGARLAAAALSTAVHEPNHRQARSDMMMASLMGGVAFQKDLGAVHSCAHALSAVCDLHHGLANALMIDTVMAWNREAAPAKFDELAHVCRVDGGGQAMVPWLRQLKADIGLTGGLAQHGVRSDHMTRLVDIAMADPCHRTNPRPCTAADFEMFFQQAL